MVNKNVEKYIPNVSKCVTFGLQFSLFCDGFSYICMN